MKCRGEYWDIPNSKKHEPIEMLKIKDGEYCCPACSMRPRLVKRGRGWWIWLIYYIFLFGLGIWLFFSEWPSMIKISAGSGFIFFSLLFVLFSLGSRYERVEGGSK